MERRGQPFSAIATIFCFRCVKSSSPHHWRFRHRRAGRRFCHRRGSTTPRRLRRSLSLARRPSSGPKVVAASTTESPSESVLETETARSRDVVLRAEKRACFCKAASASLISVRAGASSRGGTRACSATLTRARAASTRRWPADRGFTCAAGQGLVVGRVFAASCARSLASTAR